MKVNLTQLFWGKFQNRKYTFYDWFSTARPIGGFRDISGDTNNDGEMNKCWWTNKAS